MKLISIILLLLTTTLAFAQQGRHELPIDTISIGGKEQDMKMTRLEGYDELLEQLVAVRDSIAGVDEARNEEPLSESQPDEAASDSTRPSSDLEKLNHLITQMKKSESDENLMKEGYVLLDKIRDKR